MSQPEAPPPSSAPPGPASPPSPGPPSAPFGEAAATLREGLGTALCAFGGALLPAGAGAALGFWAADRDVRWAPSMVGGLCVLFVLGLVAMAVGLYLQGPAAGRRRGRRRIVVLCSLAVVAAAGRLLVEVVGAPSPLTAVDPRAYEVGFRHDGAQLRALDRGLDGVLGLLAARPQLFTGAPRPPGADDEALLVGAWETYLDAALRLDAIRRHHEDYWHLDLTRSERPRHLKSFLLTFDAELALYERTAQLMDLLDRNTDAVKFLEQPRPALGIPGGSVAGVREDLLGATDLSRVLAGERYLDWLVAVHGCDHEAAALGVDDLLRDVRARLVRVRARGGAALTTLAVGSDLAPLGRRVKQAVFPVQAGVAEWMGDARVRRPVGRYLIPARLLDDLRQRLAPGDVLLGRKNWYVSNVGLPGFWPHALLHVGTNDDLARAFDRDPEVLRWAAAEAGRPTTFTGLLAERFPAAWAARAAAPQAEPLVVIEAISEGVVQNAMAHAAGDYLVALRPRLPAAARARAVLRAFGYLGRPYDFDFDFATDGAVVCTELVWRSYRPQGPLPGLTLEPLQVAGRRAIPANEFARWYAATRGTPGAELEFVAFIDASERSGSAFFADEAAFVASAERPQWDWAQR